MPAKVPYPIRPTDSTLLSKLLTRHQINAALKKGILKGLGSYNKTVNSAFKKYEAACNKAADKLENDYNKLK
jgi:hypothetical protein